MRVDVRGDDVVAAKLDALGARALDGRPVFEKITGDLMTDEKRRFSSRGFGAWPPLKASSIARKERGGARANATTPLVASGTGRNALTTANARGQLRQIGRTEMRFGLQPQGAAYYMRFHQLGKGVPKRVVLQATATRRRIIREQVRDWVMNGTV